MLRDSDEFRDGFAICYVTVMSSGTDWLYAT